MYDRLARATGSRHLAEIDSALEEALAEACGRVVRDARGRFEVPAGGRAWAEPAGPSVFVRVALPRNVVPASRWVPQDVSSSGEVGVRAIAAAAASYLAEELRHVPPSQSCA